VGLGIAYTVSAGTSLAGAIAAASSSASLTAHAPPTRTALALGCAAFGFFFCAPLSLVPDFAALTWVSGAGAAASAFYSTAAVVAAARVRASGGPPGGKTRPPLPPPEPTWAGLSALGTIIFAFGGHVIVPEVQASLATPGSMVPALWAGYGAVAVAYTAVTAAGAAAWGGAAAEDVLLSPGAGPPWLMAAANISVLLHVAAGYQIFSQPLFAVMGRAWERRRSGGIGGSGGGQSGDPPPHAAALASGNGRSPAPSPAPSMDGEGGGLAAAAAAAVAVSAARPRGGLGGGAGGGPPSPARRAHHPPGHHPLPPPSSRRLPAALVAARLAYVLTTTVAAAAAPFIAEVMSLIGAAVFTPLTFVLPPLFAVARANGSSGNGGLKAGVARVVHLAIAGGFTVAGGVCAVAAARGLFVRARA
jgi:amino acid permease